MDSLTCDELVIRVDQTVPGRLRLNWTGRSNSRNPVLILDQFFKQVLAEASAHCSAVEMHFEALEHFNSSTIVALIHMIRAAKDARVALRLYYDGALKWQALVFDPLKRAVASFTQGAGPQVEFVAQPRAA